MSAACSLHSHGEARTEPQLLLYGSWYYLHPSLADRLSVSSLRSWRDVLTVFQARNTGLLPSPFNPPNAIIMLLLVAVHHSFVLVDTVRDIPQ